MSPSPKPATIPVKIERLPAHGQKNESPAAVQAKVRMMERRGDTAPTFQVFDGHNKRDMGEIRGHEMPEVYKYSINALRRKAGDIRKHLVETMAQREVWERIGNTPKRADEVMARSEIRAIQNQCDLHVAALSEAALGTVAAELERKRGGSASLFQETLKFIGGNANAA